MLNDYGPILIFAALAAAFPIVALWATKYFRPTPPPTAEKGMPYEWASRRSLIHAADIRFAFMWWPSFMLFSMWIRSFFIPGPLQYRVLGLFGLIEMLVFLGILIIGYIWVWKRGALEWI